jgi:hypothetical protein
VNLPVVVKESDLVIFVWVLSYVESKKLHSVDVDAVE